MSAAVFKDKQGREWVVKITVLHVKQLREQCDPPVLITDPQQLGNLLDDETRLYEVLWYLVKPQAEKYQVSEVDFAEIFTDNFSVCVPALIEGLKNFFQSCGKPELKKIIEKTLSVSKRLQEVVEKSLSSDSMDQYTNRIVTDEQDRIEKLFAEKLKTNMN